MEKNIDNFKKELKKLLIKYNADICFSCSECSDTHGLCEEQMIVNIDNKSFKLSDGWAIEQSDF